jgi:hypothetical protein
MMAVVQLPVTLVAQGSKSLANSQGLRLSIAEDETPPVLRITSPVPLKLRWRFYFRSYADGIAYYNASYPVDLPVIATGSTDRRWVAVSFTNLTGNVWSNPELTCQHVDPERPLPAREKIEWDVKDADLSGEARSGVAEGETATIFA